MKRSMPQWRFVTVFLVSAILLAGPFAGCPEAAKPQTAHEIMVGCEADVTSGLEAVETLLKSTKREKGETVAVWDDINEKNFLKFRSSTIVEFSSLLKGKTDLASTKAQEWAAAMDAFVIDLQSVGEVVEWLRKMNVLQYRIEFETDFLLVRMAEFQQELKEIGRTVAAINEEVRTGALSTSSKPETIRERADELTKARNMTESLCEALDKTLVALKDQLVAPEEMDKRIAAILEGWTNVKERHGGVKSGMTDIPPKWVPLVKNRMDNVRAARKKFDEEFDPFVSGGLFPGLPFFGAMATSATHYKDAYKPVLELEWKVRGLVEKAKEAEERRRADLAKDDALARKERARVRELEGLYGPIREREIVAGLERAAGGTARKVELKRRIDALGSGFGSKEREELKLLNEWKHPDQAAARDAYVAFYDGRAKANQEIRDILRTHAERRRTLGLRPSLGIETWNGFSPMDKKL